MKVGVANHIRRLYLKALPRERQLRAELRRIDRSYKAWIDEGTPGQRDQRIEEYFHMAEEVKEEQAFLKTRRLSRRAAKYPTVTIPHQRGQEGQEKWERGHVTGKWFLKPQAFASVYREIEDAEKRRREVWEFWMKVVGTVVPWLLALASTIVSLFLAWPWKSR